jgi:hypothetical protein
MGMLRAIVRGERAPQACAKRRAHRGQASAATSARAWQGSWRPAHRCAFQPSLTLDADSHEPSRDGDRVREAPRTGRAVPAVPPQEPTGGAAARLTRGHATPGHGCTPWPGET